jgi:hypothetical protein
MKSRIPAATVLALLSLRLSVQAGALDGKPYIHDPSTITLCDGRFYTFGTGGGGLISDDGWTWNGGAERPDPPTSDSTTKPSSPCPTARRTATPSIRRSCSIRPTDGYG